MALQEITVTLRFKVEHKPDSPAHLTQVAENYLRSKGITLLNNVIEI